MDPLEILSGLAFYKLTREGWHRIAEQLGYPFGVDDRYPSGGLMPHVALHHADVSALYAGLKKKNADRKNLKRHKKPGSEKFEVSHRRPKEDEKTIDEILSGPFPVWEWRNERRAHRPLTDANKKTEHRPDAEVRFGGDVFILERETRRSRATEEAVFDKVALRKEYIEHILKKPNHAMILFACDTPRDIQYADRARSKLDVDLFAGNPDQVVRYLLDRARHAGGGPSA